MKFFAIVALILLSLSPAFAQAPKEEQLIRGLITSGNSDYMSGRASFSVDGNSSFDVEVRVAYSLLVPWDPASPIKATFAANGNLIYNGVPLDNTQFDVQFSILDENKNPLALLADATTITFEPRSFVFYLVENKQSYEDKLKKARLTNSEAFRGPLIGIVLRESMNRQNINFYELDGLQRKLKYIGSAKKLGEKP